MKYQLYLNQQLLKEGDFKTLTALFNDLSGLNFAREKPSGWLQKMSATESYDNYLNIMAKEFQIEQWQGELILCSENLEHKRVHLFATHQTTSQQTEDTTNKIKKRRTGN